MKRQNIKKNLGCTQEELALLLAINSSQLSMYESGQRDIPTEAKQKFIALLTAAKENKTSSKKVQKIIALEHKATVLELQKMVTEKEYLLELTNQKIELAEKFRQESFAALDLITVIEKMPLFASAKDILINIQNRSEKQLKKYSEKYLTQLLLKKETLHYQHKSLSQKLKSL
ncbi:MAG: helix-turn-helix transcriptional regulator [Limnohabitans sp.]|nr:helix-turn-helix transcriptional regulator [Limnohabitans sp.]